MSPRNGHNWYATSRIAGGVVSVEHITIVPRQEWQDTSWVTGFERLPPVEERLEHGGVRQSLGCQKMAIVSVEQHMRKVGPCQQRHISVRGAKHEMMH